jgi:hypothetical protein
MSLTVQGRPNDTLADVIAISRVSANIEIKKRRLRSSMHKQAFISCFASANKTAFSSTHPPNLVTQATRFTYEVWSYPVLAMKRKLPREGEGTPFWP